MKNKEVSALFEKMADLMEFKGKNPFKVSAYTKAARVIGDLTRDIEEIFRSGDLKAIPLLNCLSAHQIIQWCGKT